MNQSVSTSIHLLILSAVIIVEILIQAYYYAELSFISNLKSSITYSLVSQYVKELFPHKEDRGEYRGRTDDLLHAMQAL